MIDLHSAKTFLIEHACSTQVSLFITILTSLWIIEKHVSAEPARGKWRHSSVNALFILTALPIQIGPTVLLIGLSAWVTTHQWGLVFLLPNASNPWIKYGLMFIALDFLEYVYHVTMHRVAGFWRFHLVHHTDLKLDVSTTVREHPGETVLRNSFQLMWVFICGASFEVIVLRQTVQTLSNILAHTALRLPAGPGRVLGWIFITPNLHHVHHHFELPYTNRNYGDVFSIWDRLFGTFTELAAEATVFGLDTHMDEAVNGTYAGAVSIPFKAVPGRR
jgi:sterol desaturase/sphingolipid hydroxylase (fatty acid hydroxylase superfamily)